MVVKDVSLYCVGCQIIVKIFEKCRLSSMPSTLAPQLDEWPHPPLDSAPKNFIQHVLKINAFTKSLVERLCDFKTCEVFVLSYTGSTCAPDKATLKAEVHASKCTTARPCNAFPSSLLLGVISMCGLGPDLVGICSTSLAARHRTAACFNTPNQGFEKIQAPRTHYNFVPVRALSSIWEKDFLALSVSCCTLDAFNIVCRLNPDGKFDEASQDKKQKVATGLLRDKLHTQEFAGPISSRTSNVFGTDQTLSSGGQPASHETCVACFLVLGPLLVFCASFATANARFEKLTLRVVNKCVVLDVRMNPIPSPTTTNALFSTICFFLFGDKPLCFH